MLIKSESNPSFSLVLALISKFDSRKGPRLRPKTLSKIGHNILPDKGGGCSRTNPLPPNVLY